MQIVTKILQYSVIIHLLLVIDISLELLLVIVVNHNLIIVKLFHIFNFYIVVILQVLNFDFYVFYGTVVSKCVRAALNLDFLILWESSFV